MTGQRQYKITDFKFGITLVNLREKARLTQKDMADGLNVSRRTIQHWEAGSAFPDTQHLKNLISFFLSYGSFTKEREKEEAIHFWEQADASAVRRRTPFDEAWFDELYRDISNVKNDKGKAGLVDSPRLPEIDWQDAPEHSEIYGRDGEILQLGRWIFEQGARFVILLGMGGIGKTSLASKFSQVNEKKFEFVIWRSLQNAPPLQDLISICIQTISPTFNSQPTVDSLLELLKKHRCLLVLDNMETIHKTGSISGEYRDGYENYRGFFIQLANSRHRSAVLLTSREIPIELEPLEGEGSAVRVMRLSGLNWEACQNLLQEKHLTGSADTWDVFVHYYAGNPLALKIAASTIRQVFGGDLGAFLSEAPVTLHTLSNMLDDQFKNLSILEREILYWLAIERETISLSLLRENMPAKGSRNALLVGLMSLRQRSLVERADNGAIFYLQPVLLEFVTNRFVEYVTAEIAEEELDALSKYPLMKSKNAEFVRESQVRMIVLPTLELLRQELGGHNRVLTLLRRLTDRLRQEDGEEYGFAAGNLLTLTAFLKGNLRSEDFSGLTLRQSFMQGIDVQDADFSNSEFIDSHFTEPIESISCMAISPGGNYLAAGSYSGQIQTWKVNGLRPLWTVRGSQREWTIIYSPDESLLASGGFMGEINLWNAVTGRLVKQVNGHRVWVYALAFRSDGKHLASGGFYGSVRIWNTSDMSLVHVLEGHSSSISSISFAAQDSLLVTSSRDGSIRVWELATGNCLHIFHHGQNGSWVRTSIHPNGHVMASNSEEDQFIKFWDILTGESLATINTQQLGSASMGFDMEGDIFAVGNQDGGVGLWKMNSLISPHFLGKLSGHQHAIEPVSFANGGILATLSVGESIKLWDTYSGKLISNIRGYSRHTEAVSFSVDGSNLVLGDGTGWIRIWEIDKKKLLHSFPAHSGPISRIAISPDGKKLASSGDDRTIHLWNLDDRKCYKTILGHTGRIFSLAFSPDSRYLASGSTDCLVLLWSAENDNNCTPVHKFENNHDQIWSLTFNPQGTILASGHVDGEIHLWSVSSGEHIITLHQDSSSWGDLVGALRFSSDGTYLFSSSANELLRRWHVESGACQVTSHPVVGNRNNTIDIGKDGRYVITGSGEPTIYVWRMDADGSVIAEEPRTGHQARVWAVALDSTETMLASCDEEGLTLITDISTGEIIQRIFLDRPYERMNIKGARGLNSAERAALKALGAVE